MLNLSVMYFVSTGSHFFILFLATLLLEAAEPLYFSTPRVDGPPLNRRLQRIGISRYDRLFQLFFSHNMKYLRRFSWIAFAHQCITMIFMISGFIINPEKFIPLLAITPIVENRTEMAATKDIFIFAAATGLHHWLPLILLICFLLRRVFLPLDLTLTENYTPLSDEIAHGEEDSEGFAFIHLTRFENSEKTIIYAYCRNDASGKIFKVAFCQGKEAGARPQCFVYGDDEYFEQIIPAPVTVSLLEEIFYLRRNEVTG